MSVVLTYILVNDPAQLYDELLRASLTPEAVNVQADTPTIVILTMPDGTDEAAVDAVIATHVPQEKYDPDELLARRAVIREENRNRGRLDRLYASFLAVGTAPSPEAQQAAIEAASLGLIKELQRLDRVRREA